MEFQLFEPYETDFHGVKPFLAKAWDFSKKDPIVDLTELTDVACNQGNIGSVLKTSDVDSSVLGVLTTLNLRQYAAELPNTLPTLRKWLAKILKSPVESRKCVGGSSTLDSLDASQNASQEAAARVRSLEDLGLSLDALLSEKNCGLLISERLMNVPPELARPAVAELVRGIEWSQETPECSEEERVFYFYDYFLGVARAWRDKDGLLFANVEEEICAQKSVLLREWTVPQADHTGPENEKRVIYLLEASRLKEIPLCL